MYAHLFPKPLRTFRDALSFVSHTYRSAYVIIQIPIMRTYLILHDRQFQFRSEPEKVTIQDKLAS
ncbi:hypothetical protein C3731_07740 [Brucella oryzae]|uniref:Uncharacterized protein n=1 Tax=Brucella oryzae TaxID=335286 RepID=A0A2S7J1S5_9HYPH|nr:hypothetical protein C3731_07740 [Brucella oryzae]